MKHNNPRPDLRFSASMRDIFAVDPAPATVTFEHDSDAIRQSMIRAGVLRPQAAHQQADEAL